FDGEKDVMDEGCLSFPEIRGEVTRPYEVKAKVQLINGNTVTIETDGLLSRAIQHETDHLNGVLFIDRMSAATKITLRGKVKKMQRDYGMR
ncbi:MAG: peptide deformylase, partial [Verrucomicrobiales bacterium]|nr:peptide deformylase [Verrucomicrobiales bacterium]